MRKISHTIEEMVEYIIDPTTDYPAMYKLGYLTALEEVVEILTEKDEDKPKIRRKRRTKAEIEAAALKHPM